MDWNKAILIGAQVVVVLVLGALVAVGKDGAIQDGLLIVSGSVTGANLYLTAQQRKSNKPSD
jgi:hypothetical protein